MIENIGSGNIAKSRLRNVLYMDRTSELLDKKLLELMKYDISKAVSKYIKINTKNIELTIESQNSNSDKFGAVLCTKIYIDNFLNCMRKDNDDKKKA